MIEDDEFEVTWSVGYALNQPWSPKAAAWEDKKTSPSKDLFKKSVSSPPYTTTVTIPAPSSVPKPDKNVLGQAEITRTLEEFIEAATNKVIHKYQQDLMRVALENALTAAEEHSEPEGVVVEDEDELVVREDIPGWGVF